MIVQFNSLLSSIPDSLSLSCIYTKILSECSPFLRKTNLPLSIITQCDKNLKLFFKFLLWILPTEVKRLQSKFHAHVRYPLPETKVYIPLNFVCDCVCVTWEQSISTVVHMWTGDSLMESVLFLCMYVDSRNQTHVFRLVRHMPLPVRLSRQP